MELGHYASQSTCNISAHMGSILIRRSLRSRFTRAVTAALVHRQVVTAVSVREAVGGTEVSVNRTSAGFIPLCSASVPTKSSASCVMTLVITSRAGHRPAKIGEDRIGKIGISIPVDCRGR